MAKHHRSGHHGGSRRLKSARRRASLETALNFGPQTSALRDLARTARSNYDTTLGQEQDIRKGLTSAATKGLRETRKDYRSANQTRHASYHSAQGYLKGLSEAADPFRAASAREGQVEKSNLALERAGALDEMLSRRTDAAAGYGLATRNARAQYQSDLGDIASKAASLNQQKGKFKVATIEDILDKYAEQSLKNKSLRETHRHNVQGERSSRANARTSRGNLRERQRHDRHTEANSGGSGSGSSGGKLTPNEQNGAFDDIDSARGFYNQYVKSGKLSVHQLKLGLNQGYLTDANGKRLSLKQIAPAYVSAGFELGKHRYITKRTAHTLKARGLRVGKHYRIGGGHLSQNLSNAFSGLTGH